MSNKKLINEAGTVAHYTKLEHLANILYDKQLLLSPVENLHDPRENPENWICLGGIGDHHEANQLSAEKIKSDAAHQIRVLCTLADKKKHEPDAKITDTIKEASYSRPRMWAQYGDQSKGFCVVLNRERLDNNFEELANKLSAHIISKEVDYPHQLSATGDDVLIEHGPDYDPGKHDIFELLNHNERIQSIYFRKDKDWAGENEYRLLLYHQIPGKIFVSIEEAVKAVVLGCKFPANQIPQAKEYCKELGCDCIQLEYSHPEYEENYILK